MLRVKEVIVVEGKYDKNTLSQVVQATIVETSGFGIFSCEERLRFLRRMAEERGLIVLTDSDSAGFVIRNFLKGAIPKHQLKQAYIPDRYGKEKRKQCAGKEGKLGVEGMPADILLDALRRAGATFCDETAEMACHVWEKSDLYEMGFLGRPESGIRRKQMLRQLDLPEHLSTNALLDLFRLFYTKEKLKKLLSDMNI
ncbi:MAG: toprim domain-containing protein [Oscillospiraceae bacterium]|jgi:ribonuclease M5